MTRKSIANLVDGIILQVAAAHGVPDFAGRKGIDPKVHLVNGKVFEALERLTGDIVAATNPPAPAPVAVVPEGWGEVGGVEETEPAVAA